MQNAKLFCFWELQLIKNRQADRHPLDDKRFKYANLEIERHFSCSKYTISKIYMRSN